MIRIISGLYGGRRIAVPGESVRPTQDRVREAVFSALGDSVAGSRVLDLFAGSGALGLEACSRGAASCVWVEKSRRVFRVLQSNVSGLYGPQTARQGCRCRDVFDYLGKEAVADGPFDLVFADPPYETKGPTDRADRLLGQLSAGPQVRPGGFFLLEQGHREEVIDSAGWNILQQKAYGDTRVVWYRRVTS